MAAALDTFDPYREWLGIDPRELPADHYRLLGLPRFEIDAARIAAAADERMGYIRKLQTGPRAPYTARLLNELSTAKLCLLSPATKAVYDARLQAQLLASRAPSPAPLPQWTAYPAAVSAPAAHAPPLAAPPQMQRELPVDVEPLAPPKMDVVLVEEQPRSRTGAWIALGVVVAVALAAAVIWSVTIAAGQHAARVLAEQAAQERAAAEAARKAAEKSALVLLQESNGEISFPPATATLAGSLELEPTGFEDLLVNWTSAAEAQWRFRLVRPGFFNVEITYATPEGAGGAFVELQIGQQTKTCELRPSGGKDKFLSTTSTVAVTSSGENVLSVRSLARSEKEAFALKLVRLVPVGGESGL